MNKSSRFLIRISAFLFKEIFEVMRQPLLILTLVLGPFLILLFFGIGYRNEARALRTVFVVEEDSGLAQKVEEYASSLGPQLVFAGIMDDVEAAQERLRQGEVDLVVVMPADAYDTIRNNEQAIFQLYHHEIDPFQSDYIRVFGRVYVDEVNRRVLRFITSEGQMDATQAQEKLDAARLSAANLRELLEQCTTALTQSGRESQCNSQVVFEYMQDLDRRIDEIELAMGDTVELTETIQQELSKNTGQDTTDNQLSSSLTDIIQNTNELTEFRQTADGYIDSLKILAEIETDLARLEAGLTEFLDIDPIVLISPFRSEVQSIATVVPGASHYFAPAVIVLLLQHFAVTFAALSMVRERQLGTMELFFVSPISAIETLLGKYLSYLVFGGALAAILLMLLVFGMGVPMLGQSASVGLVIIALIFTSLGIGFVISLFSKTDIQAVQYSMIVLLTSVFFSGFILGLETLWEPVRIISWALPATYGILLLRDVMLRGEPLVMTWLAQLVVIGLALFVAAWVLLQRSMSN